MANISILIVDDDTQWCDILKREIERMLDIKEVEYRIQKAVSIIHVLLLLEEQQFDLIISDIRLDPQDIDVNGIFTILHKVQQNNLNTKIVFISGYITVPMTRHIFQSKSVIDVLDKVNLEPQQLEYILDLLLTTGQKT